MMTTLRNNNKGFTLMEVLVSLGITAIATLSLFSILQMYYSATSRSNTRSSVMDIELDAYFIQENLAEWISNTIDSAKPTFYIPEISRCLRPTGANCPSALSSALLNSIHDPELASYISVGKIISTTPIKNLQGQLIAGPVDQPIYYTSNGQQVRDRAQAAYSVAGVMVRDNNTGQPGKVVLMLRVAPENTDKNGPMRTRWVRINIGSRWQLVSAEISGSCTAGQYVVGVDSTTGSVLCQGVQDSCPPNSFATGFGVNGKFICSALPPAVTARPYTPPATYTCDSHGYSIANCTIPLPSGKRIKAITVKERHSRASCVIGDNVKLIGNTISVGDGCRATFNVFYDDI